MKSAFTVFPKPPGFVQPPESPSRCPPFRQRYKAMQSVSFYNPGFRAADFLYGSGEVFARIPAANYKLLN
ncbi:MAG: hypothetical protein Pg6C_16060 [Treponemataceae bacterium]|nr:MAG: hypothetical protein Pg6C_16060 [Treponemataceae bacterium]